MLAMNCAFHRGLRHILRPQKLKGSPPPVFRKKMKSVNFAAAVSREDIVRGAEELGVDLTNISISVLLLWPMPKSLSHFFVPNFWSDRLTKNEGRKMKLGVVGYSTRAQVQAVVELGIAAIAHRPHLAIRTPSRLPMTFSLLISGLMGFPKLLRRSRLMPGC